MIPPSPALRDLLAWKEKQPARPRAPAPLTLPSGRRHWVPWAWAASSITCRSWRRARSLTASMSAMVPKTWTGMMALRAGGDRALGGGHVEAEGLRVEVGEDGHAVGGQDGAGGGDPGHPGDDHLVPVADPGRLQGRLQGGGAAGDADAVAGPLEGGEAGRASVLLHRAVAGPLAAGEGLRRQGGGAGGRLRPGPGRPGARTRRRRRRRSPVRLIGLLPPSWRPIEAPSPPSRPATSGLRTSEPNGRHADPAALRPDDRAPPGRPPRRRGRPR